MKETLLNTVNRNPGKYHLIFICDDSLIFHSFEIIKQLLISPVIPEIKVLYLSQHSLYIKEFSMLEKTFGNNLQIYSLNNTEDLQTYIEAILNSNVREFMRFILINDNEINEAVKDILLFLNVEQQIIETF